MRNVRYLTVLKWRATVWVAVYLLVCFDFLKPTERSMDVMVVEIFSFYTNVKATSI